MSTTDTQHTPGPWQLEIDTVFVCDDVKIQPVRYNGDIEGMANARLIAAAPELLAALELMVKYYSPMDHIKIDDRTGYDALKSGIAAIKLTRTGERT